MKLRGHGDMEMLTKLEVHRARSGPRAWPVQVQHVLQSKVRTSHCPRREAQARTCLGDHSDPDNPFRGTEMQVRLLKIINAALFTKGAGPGLVPPARPSDSHGGWGGGVSQLSLGGQGQVGLTVGAVLPPAALVGLLPSGSRGQHCCLRKALSALGSPRRTAGRGRPGTPSRSPGGGPGR